MKLQLAEGNSPSTVDLERVFSDEAFRTTVKFDEQEIPIGDLMEVIGATLTDGNHDSLADYVASLIRDFETSSSYYRFTFATDYATQNLASDQPIVFGQYSFSPKDFVQLVLFLLTATALNDPFTDDPRWTLVDSMRWYHVERGHIDIGAAPVAAKPPLEAQA
jgi:hypothetical protein